MIKSAIKTFALLLVLVTVSGAFTGCTKKEVHNHTLLNVSYDPTRELYAEYNKIFEEYWQKKTGDILQVKVSNGGSGKQARAVIDGLEADVVTLALASDINAIAEKTQLLPEDWQRKFPDNSSPYISTIVFLVRKGNPKNIRDWDDLVKPGVGIITPNPKTSGGARWNFLAAWAFAQKKQGADDEGAKAFVTALFKNVPVLDTGARGSTNTFVQRGIGDVLLAWENEALLTLKEEGPDKFEIVVPSLSILAEPPVAIVEKNAEKHGTTEIARAYIEYLYSDAGQELVARHFYRPNNPDILAKHAGIYPKLELVTIDQDFGGWKHAQKHFFGDGGVFDQIYQEKK
jgi:sulfate transport system substrate-binding protein